MATDSIRARRMANAAILAEALNAPPVAFIAQLQEQLQATSIATLVGFLRSGIDARMMLGKSLADRGLNQDGAWVGFDEAERLFREAFAVQLRGIEDWVCP